jgi:hypothetical protein
MIVCMFLIAKILNIFSNTKYVSYGLSRFNMFLFLPGAFRS